MKMAVLGYILAVLMGVTLGLIGAGGSILTVPILVYLFDVKPVVATGYSLLIVGVTALFGAVCYGRYKAVNFRVVFIFAAPAMLAVLFTRSFIVPSIPDPVFGISEDSFIMFLFAALMILVAYFMLRSKKAEPVQNREITFARLPKLIAGSCGVGLLTGMVGAGGGFLIVPSLIALFGLSMKEAIATSPAIIAVNSLVGFKGDIARGIELDYSLLALFLAMTLLGMWAGVAFGKFMDGAKLKKIFGIFTLIIGALIAIEELYKIFS